MHRPGPEPACTVPHTVSGTTGIGGGPERRTAGTGQRRAEDDAAHHQRRADRDPADPGQVAAQPLPPAAGRLGRRGPGPVPGPASYQPGRGLVGGGQLGVRGRGGVRAVLVIGGIRGIRGIRRARGSRREQRIALVLRDQGHGRPGQVGVLPGRVRAGLGKLAELGEQRGRRQAFGRPTPHAGGDERGELGGQVGQVGLLGGQPGQHVHDRVPAIGRVPGRREGQRGAQRVHVAGRRGPGALVGLLRGHVRRRADGAVRGGNAHAFGRPGHAEVDHPRPVRRDQHIGRLKVTVHQADAVDRVQRLRAPGGEPPDRRHRQRAAGPDQSAQRRRRHIRGGQPGQVGVGIGLDDGGGEEPAHPARGRYLLREPGAESRLLGQFHPDRLHRDQPPGRGTAQEDLPHRPGAQAAEDHVGPDPLRVPPAQPRSSPVPVPSLVPSRLLSCRIAAVCA